MILSWVWQIMPTMAINDGEKWKCVNFCVNISLVTVKGRAKSNRISHQVDPEEDQVEQISFLSARWRMPEVSEASLQYSSGAWQKWFSHLLFRDLLLGCLQNQNCHKAVIMPTVLAGHALLWTTCFQGLEREESPALNTSFLSDLSLFL